MKANEFKTMIDCLDPETYEVAVYPNSDSSWGIALYRNHMSRLDLRHTRDNTLREFKTLDAANRFLKNYGVNIYTISTV